MVLAGALGEGVVYDDVAVGEGVDLRYLMADEKHCRAFLEA